MSPATNPKGVVWDPIDYAANSPAQLAWARELITRLRLRGKERILDVGCGDGKVTAELARALPHGSATGVDSSPEMLRFARDAFPAKKFPRLAFFQMDARELRFASSFDIIFSNAALHWVDDHPAFLRSAGSCLKPEGRLVVSCGGKGNAHAVFMALRATMRLKRWRVFFRKLAAPYFFHRPEDYENWLPRCGFDPQLVRLTNKDVQFAGCAALAAWIRTTWLPYTQRVPVTQREEFIGDVVAHYAGKHPPDAQGNLNVRMVRLEIHARKVAERVFCRMEVPLTLSAARGNSSA